MSVRVIHGDMLAVLPTLDADSIHSVVTDPPYHLTSIVKRFGSASAAPANVGQTGAFARASRGFMGQTWDGGDIAMRPETWAEVFRVMKPGAHIVAFGGTRTYHRMACAIEDAGFEIRDTLCWLYGSGFPKSHSINNALSGIVCDCEDEPTPECNLHTLRHADVSAPVDTRERRGEVLFASVPEQSPFSNRPQSPKGSKGRAELGMEGGRDLPESPRELRERPIRQVSAGIDRHGAHGRLCDGASAGNGAMGGTSSNTNGMRPPRGPQATQQRKSEPDALAGQPQSQDGGAWPVCGRCGKQRIPDGIGSALKPAFEPIILARKPLDGTIAGNTLKHGCGGINVDACRIEAPEGLTSGGNKTSSPLHMDRDAGINRVSIRAEESPLGRFPANVCHDGSDEVLGAFAEFGEKTSGSRSGYYANGTFSSGTVSRELNGDSGSASRFFYCAKADADDRAGSKHPTVKPLALMTWLVKLITPPGGTVLDPFSGSGTTLLAADRLRFNAIGVEQSAEYVADIHRRLRSDAGLFAEIVDAPVPQPPEDARVDLFAERGTV